MAEAKAGFSDDGRATGLQRRQQLAVGTITIVCLCLMVTSWAVEFWRRGRSVDIQRPFTPPNVQLKIDLNRAPWPELTLLPGISETMARRVVEHRQRHGRFHTLEEIQQVKGIGPRTFARIEPYLYVPASDFAVEDAAQ